MLLPTTEPRPPLVLNLKVELRAAQRLQAEAGEAKAIQKAALEEALEVSGREEFSRLHLSGGSILSFPMLLELSAASLCLTLLLHCL